MIEMHCWESHSWELVDKGGPAGRWELLFFFTTSLEIQLLIFPGDFEIQIINNFAVL